MCVVGSPGVLYIRFSAPAKGIYIVISCDENLGSRAGVHASVSVPCWWGTTDAEIKGPLGWESRAVKCAFFFLSNPGAFGLECVCVVSVLRAVACDRKVDW